MLDLYVAFLKDHPIASSALQVGVLGTFGELLGCRICGRGWNPFTPGRLALKVAVWAFLGVTFKYAFTGFFGFVDALSARGYWPSFPGGGVGRAFSVSLYCNALFGPVMMSFHRWTDAKIEKVPMTWEGLYPAWATLAWFWVPAHTVTFSLPPHVQVGLAALWALALGALLGFFARARSAAC
jgi:hypothetical protein